MSDKQSNPAVGVAPAVAAAAQNAQQRRLSFIGDSAEPVGGASDSQESTKKRQSSISQSQTQQQQQAGYSGERRQSILWNPSTTGGGAGAAVPRKSIYQRRMSYALSQGSRKSSQDLSGYSRMRLQNTYRTEPNSEAERFKPYKLEPKLYTALEEALKDKKYEASKTAQLTKDLSQLVMRETRLMMNTASPRYKLVSHVLVGEMKNQDIRHGSRCLWDVNLDNFVSVVYKNSSLFAVATVFALYYE